MISATPCSILQPDHTAFHLFRVKECAATEHETEYVTNCVQAGRVVFARAADRPLWNPGNEAPAWLDGSLAGDYGFDPLGLGSDPETLKYFVQAELVHARYASVFMSLQRLCPTTPTV